MKRRIMVWLIALFLLGSAALAEDLEATATSGSAITSLAQLNDPGIKLGLPLSSAADEAVRQQLPLAQLVHYNDNLLGFMDVAQGRIDAFVYDEVQMKLSMENGITGVRMLDEFMDKKLKICVGISPVSQIPGLEDSVNRFIAEMKSAGVIDDMLRRWVWDAERTLPEIELPADPQFHLIVGTSGIVMPYSYYEGDVLTGFDIEMAYRFAQWLGADLEFQVYDYSAIVPAAVSGKVDVVMANLQYTDERAESGLIYSDELYAGRNAILVRDDVPQEDVARQAGGAYTSLAQLKNARIGVQTGTTFDEIVLEALPDAQISYFNSYPDMAAALEANKIDAFPGDEPVLQLMAAENEKLTILNDRMDSFEFGFVLPKTDSGEKLLTEINAWLADIKASGELDEVVSKWTSGPEADKTLPDYSGYPAPNGTLTMATEGAYAPMNYYRGDEVVGFEIDLAARFCEANGYGLAVEAMNFDGILPAVQAGKVDFAAAGITITEERAESVNFSTPYYTGGTVMVVRKGEQVPAATGVQPELTSFSDLAGKTVSMITGVPLEAIVRSKAPDVGAFTTYNNMPDMILALRSGKTDAVLSNNAVAALSLSRNPDLALLPQDLQSSAFGFAFAKGDPRRDEWQAAFDAIPEAQIQAAWDKWTGGDESLKVLPEQDWPGANGTVRVAACDTLEPLSYVGGDGELKGFDLEVLLMTARELDMRVEFTGMEMPAILASVQSGKADISIGSIIVTEERAQAVDFLEYYPAAFVLVVRAAKVSTVETTDDETFLGGIKSSFHKTFIREDRWRLFVNGVLTTLLITALTILFGTLLGFGVFMLCRNGNPVANLVTRFCLWLVQGMPMVVLLMILYYIIFGNVAISGIAVAVLGFTLTFGAAVFGLLKMGVGAVDVGQYEAAYALGYSNRRTFFKIILPQALPHVLPAYKGEIVGLIKATAIVGYIAVQDLTKMGDIVRSRTYEAFFPLIAVTVIYFALEGLIGFLVSRISVGLNPKRRKPADILKGVKTCDQN